VKLDELEKLAHDEWIGDDEDARIELQFQGETILALIVLLREMGECLLHCYAETDARINKRAAVLAKYKEMTNG